MAAKDKRVKNNNIVSGRKIPKNQENPDSYLNKTPLWGFNKCDRTHEKWALRDCTDIYGVI